MKAIELVTGLPDIEEIDLITLDDTISFITVMFTVVLPALLTLLIFLWFRDWVIKVYKKWKRSAESKLEEMREDRWYAIAELMKVIMFFVLLLPLLSIIEFAINEDAIDPSPTIFNETMWYVFIIITVWYLFASVIYGVYKKSKEYKQIEETLDQQME